MRYILQEIQTVTVEDKEISSDQEIISILKDIKSNKHNINISFEDYNSNFSRTIENARILEINESLNTIDIQCFMNSGTMKHKDIKIYGINQIKIVNTVKNLIKKSSSSSSSQELKFEL